MDTIAKKIAEVKNRKLSKQVYTLLESIRKYPLSFTHKHDIKGFQNALNVKENINKLQDSMSNNLNSINEAAYARVTLQSIN